MEKYKKISTLGRGFYGTVLLIQELESKKFYAMKKIFIENENESDVKEIEILKFIQHPNVVQYYDTFKED